MSKIVVATSTEEAIINIIIFLKMDFLFRFSMTLFLIFSVFIFYTIAKGIIKKANPKKILGIWHSTGPMKRGTFRECSLYYVMPVYIYIFSLLVAIV